MGVHGSVVLEAVGRVSRTAPVLGVVLAIGPIRSKFATERKAGLRLVVRKFDGELASGGEGHRVAVLWRVVETAKGLSLKNILAQDRALSIDASYLLHPPFVLGQLVQGIHRSVGVGVIVVGVGSALAIHALDEGRSMRRGAACEN